jgi:hypothetical protein
MTHDLNVYMAKSFHFVLGQHVIARWPSNTAHATVVKVNPLSLRVVIDDDGEWKGREIAVKLMGPGERVYDLKDPAVQKWLAKNPQPATRSTKSEMESKKAPRTLPGNFERKGRIPKNRLDIIKKILSNVKSVYLYHYDEMSGQTSGTVEKELVPQVIQSALEDLKIHGSYLRNDGNGQFTVHVHSNLFYTFRII